MINMDGKKSLSIVEWSEYLAGTKNQFVFRFDIGHASFINLLHKNGKFNQLKSTIFDHCKFYLFCSQSVQILSNM